MKNLDSIANELFNKIRGRYPSITVGDADATITNAPKEARFFEFDFAEDKKVSISLDEKDLTIMYSQKLFDDQDVASKSNWFAFLKELRQFAKKRMLNFDTRDITKSNLDKRDYQTLSTEKQMSESKLYGTSRTSFQDIGSAKMVIKHTQPINQEQPAGRTRDIAGIYIESKDGERFKYPIRHMNGARAMAMHVSEGGNPYDDFGKHIVGLSEELSKLRKFKTYMNRSNVMAEGLAGYMDVVNDRIETVKKTTHALQSKTRYKEAFENFDKTVLEEVPEDVSNTWIDELTIKQFNEELKGVFPYIYKLVSEANKVKELGPEDISEGMESDEVMGILKRHPQEFAKMKQTGDLMDVYDTPLYQELFSYYADSGEMPYGTMKARDGDPVQFIIDKLDDLGVFDNNEGRVKDMVMDMEDEAVDMSRDDFIEKYGRGNADIWDRMNDEDYMDPSDFANPEEEFEQHMDSIVNSAEFNQEAPMTEYERAFEDFKMAAANAAAKGEKDFEYPKGSGKKHPTKMDKATAAKLLADSQTNELDNPLGLDEAQLDEISGIIKKGAGMAGGALKNMFGKGGQKALGDIAKLGAQGAKKAGQGAVAVGKHVGRNKLPYAAGAGGVYAYDKAGDVADYVGDKVDGVTGAIKTAQGKIGSAADNVSQVVSGLGDKVANTADELKGMAKGALDGLPNMDKIAALAKQHAIPAAVVIGLLLGGGVLLAKMLGGKDKDESAGDDNSRTVDVSPKGAHDEMKAKNEIPLDEFVKSMYDYTHNSFPKGETAVLTAVQKQYGQEAVEEAGQMIQELLAGQNQEMARIQQLAGLR